MITSINEYKKFLNESVNFPDRFYHGSSKESNALQIIQDGVLKPGNVDIKRGGKLTPKMGMVYLTPKVEEAGIYAIGANILGSKIWDGMIDKDGRYGYLFVIDGHELHSNNVYADEDYIGQAIHHLATNKFYDSEFGKDIQNFKYATELLHSAKYNLTPLQYQKVLRYDDYADFAVAGKKLMHKLSNHIHQDLIRLGSPAAVEGAVKISEAWKIDKEKCQELKKDGSNFFQIAEKININDINESLEDKNSLNNYIYHASNISNRDMIDKNGILTYRGVQWMEDTEIEGKAVFATNSDNPKDWFDSTYDDDIWQIDTTKIPNIKWKIDPNYSWSKNYKHIYTQDAIPREAIKLIKRGTGKDNLFESFDSERIWSGKEVNNHIKEITPDHSDLPDYYMDTIIKYRKFKIQQINLNDLLKSDLAFKEYYESGEDRYGDNDEDNDEYVPYPEEINNEIVVVDGELLDGYSRASSLLRMGETTTNGYVALPKNITITEKKKY